MAHTKIYMVTHIDTHGYTHRYTWSHTRTQSNTRGNGTHMDTWLHMVTHMDADGHTGEWHTHGYTWLHTWIHIVKYMDEDTHGTDTHIDTHLHTYVSHSHTNKVFQVVVVNSIPSTPQRLDFGGPSGISVGTIALCSLYTARFTHCPPVRF